MLNTQHYVVPATAGTTSLYNIYCSKINKNQLLKSGSIQAKNFFLKLFNTSSHQKNIERTIVKISYISYLLLIAALYNLQIDALVTKKKQAPKVTVIMVIDQFAHHYLPKLGKHLQFGINKLLNNGIVYENAYHAHGFPETAPGHTALNTGVFPKDHGVVSNQWLTCDGKKTEVLNDDAPAYPTFGPDKQTNACSCSPLNILVDGFSDQFCMHSTKAHQRKAFSISLKARAAIGTANKVGKAIWFDDVNGLFTSSKFYFDQLPSWLTRFNTACGISNQTSISWDSCFPLGHPAYKFPFIRDYASSEPKKALAPSQEIPIDRTSKNPFALYGKTPLANQHLLNLAIACLEANLSQTSTNESMVLWVCLSPLDFAGHIYGPDSFELIDHIYHLDKQLDVFMTQVQRRYGRSNVLFVLTADHGIQPMQEISYKKGIKNARRIMSDDLIKKMNDYANQAFELDNIVVGYEGAHFILDQEKKNNLDKEVLASLINGLKKVLLAEPGIKKVWTDQELSQAQFGPHDLEQFYKNSHHALRSGDLICMPEPYCLITPYATGCSHATPYDYDTHVPLMIYQHGRFMKKTINEKVWVTQLAGTLSHIHQVPRPSASVMQELPGIF